MRLHKTDLVVRVPAKTLQLHKTGRLIRTNVEKAVAFSHRSLPLKGDPHPLESLACRRVLLIQMIPCLAWVVCHVIQLFLSLTLPAQCSIQRRKGATAWRAPATDGHACRW